jgi:hypothetical protein
METPAPTYHQLMQPKIINFKQRMMKCLTEQRAPHYIVEDWGNKIQMMHDSSDGLFYLVHNRICGKWLRHSTEKDCYFLDMKAMEEDKEDAIKNMGGMVNFFKSKDEERLWYECARWELTEEGKKLVNDYFVMFADVYIKYYDTEEGGIAIPEV